MSESNLIRCGWCSSDPHYIAYHDLRSGGSPSTTTSASSRCSSSKARRRA